MMVRKVIIGVVMAAAPLLPAGCAMRAVMWKTGAW